MKRLCSALAIVFAGAAMTARPVDAGSILAISSVKDSSFVVKETLGYSFTALDDLIATDLGMFDLDLGPTYAVGNGLREAHTVGLWKADGTLLSSAVVPAGTAGTLVGGFRYTPIAPVLLESGATFVVGVHYLGTLIDAYTYPSAATFTWDSLIAPGTGVDFKGGFGFPNKSLGFIPGGPNLIVSAAPDPTPVPEPGSTFALLGAVLVGAAAARRWTRL